MEKVIESSGEKSQQLKQLYDLTTNTTSMIVHTNKNQKIVLSQAQLELIRRGINQCVDTDPSIYLQGGAMLNTELVNNLVRQYDYKASRSKRPWCVDGRKHNHKRKFFYTKQEAIKYAEEIASNLRLYSSGRAEKKVRKQSVQKNFTK